MRLNYTAFEKSQEKVTALIADMPLKDVASRIAGLRSAPTAAVDAVLKRADKDSDSPDSAPLYAWIAMNSGSTAAGKKAIDVLLEKHPDHTAINQITQRLSFGGSSGAEDTLKRILDKATKASVKASAAIALGKLNSQNADRLADNLPESDRVAAQAEKYLEQAISLLGKENEALTKQAEQELKALRTLRVGKPVPEIAAEDLDGKEFKLSDYRGKVVLLDFWGHW